MNLNNIGCIRSFDEIEYTSIFWATLRDLDIFFGTKGFSKSKDGIETDMIIWLGPLPHPSRDVSGPCIYSPSVLHDHPVLDLDANIKLIPSLKIDYANTLDDNIRPGDLVFVKDKILLNLSKERGGFEYSFLNMETGEITVGLHESYGFVVRGWSIQTIDPINPETILSYPFEGKGS
jgi:hypothetical protein